MISKQSIPEFFAVLLLVVLVADISLTSAQVGAKCSERIAELYPRQLLDLDMMVGEWYILEVARGAVTPLPYSCMSQVFGKQNNSDNLNIRLKVNATTENGNIYLERDGQVNITASDPASWRWSYFDYPAQYWDGVVIATDYENYWIHYECEEIGDLRSENAVIRYRSRNFASGQKVIYESLLEGLGFPRADFLEVSHIDCGDVKG